MEISFEISYIETYEISIEIDNVISMEISYEILCFYGFFGKCSFSSLVVPLTHGDSSVRSVKVQEGRDQNMWLSKNPRRDS